ncbi:Long chain base2 isoform 1 [Hibiscus syriacus]|uniref:Long chain base2 isoform 1 n=1 Tax=Hibiscus syriacus TaxID=106335 RepID=A0A6A3B418_HIBSY|nr:Long chain base2 isoform 1 [Hibiscus syriacus]
MVETKSSPEPALPAKRKADPTSQDHDPQQNLPLKSPNSKPKMKPSYPNEDPSVDSEEGEEEEEEDDDYEDDEDDDEEEENGSAPVDRKGKGVLIEEEIDSDDDDSSDGGNESEGDLSDDPLAEVDLDNILPSRTRRRVVRSGVRISKEVGNKGKADDGDDSAS